MSRSNSEVESSFLIYMVHHPGQNLLPFPLCFHNLIYASLLAFKSPDCLFVHCDYFLFIQHWFIHSKNIYWAPTIFQVLVCMYQFKNKRKHRLKKKNLWSPHGAWVLVMKKFWVPWLKTEYPCPHHQTQGLFYVEQIPKGSASLFPLCHR